MLLAPIYVEIMASLWAAAVSECRVCQLSLVPTGNVHTADVSTQISLSVSNKPPPSLLSVVKWPFVSTPSLFSRSVNSYVETSLKRTPLLVTRTLPEGLVYIIIMKKEIQNYLFKYWTFRY